MDGQLMTVRQVAERMQVPEETVRRAAINGKWPHTRPNRKHIRFSEADYEQILTLLRIAPKTAAADAGPSPRARRTAAASTTAHSDGNVVVFVQPRQRPRRAKHTP